MDTAGLQNQGSGYQPMSIGDWIITFIVTAIPLVGFIMLFVWAFGDGTHPSKKTWAQAYLILMVVFIILMIIFFTVFASLLSSFVGGYQQSV
jgi:membrane-associated HD superfamily phosphohydrolase